MPVSAVDIITPAIEHTKAQLTRPFRFWQWTRLAFVGLVAGELGTGGGCNGANFHMPSDHGSTRHFLESGFPWSPALSAGVVALLIVTGIVLWLALLYASSVMRFVLFDSILRKECHIRQYWNARREPGFRYFVWQLLYGLAMMAGLVVFVGIPLGIAAVLGWLQAPGQHVLALVLGGIVLFLILLGFFTVAVTVHVLTKDFVVPQMALENLSALEGWKRLWRIMQPQKGSFAGYIGMKIVLAIAAAMIFGILTLIVMLILAVPLIVLGLVAGVGGAAAGLEWNVYTITLAVVVGIIAFAVFFYIAALISVPSIVFFPAYSIHFFATRYRSLEEVLRPAPPDMPQPPPLLPPEPSPIG